MLCERNKTKRTKKKQEPGGGPDVKGDPTQKKKGEKNGGTMGGHKPTVCETLGEGVLEKKRISREGKWGKPIHN